MESTLFIIVGLVAILAAAAMVLSRNAVHSALFLIVNFACVAFLYLLLDAPFLSMIQLAVYAGAIMVLFLFVIMLLGAERTTDTTRRFQRTMLGALLLAAVFLLVIGLPLVAGQFDLPAPKGASPIVRVAHAATDIGDVDIVVDGEVLAESVNFDEATDFFSTEAGAHTITLRDHATGAALLDVEVELENGDVITVVAYGTGTDVDVALVEDDLSTVANDSGRLLLFNGYSDSPISLVDFGPNRELDVADMPLNDEHGNVLVMAEGSIIKAPQVSDRVVIEALPYGEAAFATLPAGDYTLGYVVTNTTEITAYPAPADTDGSFVPAEDTAVTVAIPQAQEVIRTERNYAVDRNTEVLLFLTGERLADGRVRPFPLTLVTDATPVFGGPEGIAQTLYTAYVLPIQLVAILLLVAIVGAIVLTKREEGESNRRLLGRRRVSKPLASVITSQTGTSPVAESRRELPGPETPSEASGD